MTPQPIKQAFILGAGLGNRMRPLTDEKPKPMVTLGGKPMIDHVLEGLAKAGVEKFIVNVHYKADVLEEHLRQKNNLNIIISDEREKLLDTGGGLVKASSHLDDAPFFIHNSDSVWIEEPTARLTNLQRMAERFDAREMVSLMLLANRTHSLGYDGKGDFIMHEDHHLVRRTNAQETDFVYAGVSIATPELLKGAPSGSFSLNKLWDGLLQKKSIYGLNLQGKWMHVGTPKAMEEAEICLKEATESA